MFKITKKYSPQYVKELFDFFINNKIKVDTIEKLNYYFKTDFKYLTLTRLFRKYNFKLSNYEFYSKRMIGQKKYNKEIIEKMFNFYIKNNCSKNPQNYKKIQNKFNYPFKRRSLISLFNKNDLKISASF